MDGQREGGVGEEESSSRSKGGDVRDGERRKGLGVCPTERIGTGKGGGEGRGRAGKKPAFKAEPKWKG